jgi:hypothetical protein
MVNNRNDRADPETSRANGNPPPPQTLAQAIASVLESRDEQTELLNQLVASSNRGGHGASNARGQAQTTHAEFLATHLPTFAEVGEPLEADHWLHTIEFKFGLICCTEHQKTLFVAQQLLGNAGARWTNFTTVLPTNHQVQWAAFCEAFRAQHIPAGIMLTKQQEFMDLRQGGRSVHDYSKLFNHLA